MVKQIKNIIYIYTIKPKLLTFGLLHNILTHKFALIYSVVQLVLMF